jgi:hypothetical protein
MRRLRRLLRWLKESNARILEGNFGYDAVVMPAPSRPSPERELSGSPLSSLSDIEE